MSSPTGIRGSRLSAIGALFAVAGVAAALSWPLAVRSSSERASSGNPIGWSSSRGEGKPISPASPGLAVQLPQPIEALPGARPSVFSPNSSFPVEDRSTDSLSADPVAKDPDAQPGCDICMEGYAYNSWSGNSGNFTLDRIQNHRSSGTSGTLRLQMRLSPSYPVFGGTISSYAQSNTYQLGTLSAGYYYNNISSGTIAYYNDTIPAGTYYQFMMSYEYSGTTWYYTDFIVMDTTVTCTGSGCSSNSGPTPTPTRSATATPPVSSCYEDTYNICLFNNRFRVSATYRDYSNNTGSARAVRLTSDSGYFWFFSSTNVELVAKIVSFCNGSSGNYGLYASGLTDVNVTFTVTDTKTQITRNYVNPLGNRFCTIGDGWNVCP